VCQTHGSNRWSLSRFAYLHRENSRLVLKCPEAPCDIELDDPDMVRWIYDISTSASSEPESVQAEVLSLLAGLGFIEDAEEEEPASRQAWEFHDRLFHFQSQIHEEFRPYGATYRFRERSGNEHGDRPQSPPAIRPPYAGDMIELPAPETTASRPLLDIMESRRSRREMGHVPVSLDQIAILLYRVARVTRRIPSALQMPQDLLQRPYPSGGSIHELEFYLAVRVCRGLVAGFYHYRGDIHAMTRLPGGSAEGAASAMISHCAQAWWTNGQDDTLPQCVVVVSSRLPRLAWKYASIAYRLSMLNAGCVLQSLYLVSTDIGLNGSAAGVSRPTLFAQATGVSSWEETSIVEFGFGNRPDRLD
jgi:SagB-type dehydrogenase family enzyme